MEIDAVFPETVVNDPGYKRNLEATIEEAGYNAKDFYDHEDVDEMGVG